MEGAVTSLVDELAPTDAYAALKTSGSAAIVDVRTRAEWAFVGVPDVSETGRQLFTVEWVTFPQMTPNQHFLDQLLEQVGGELPERLFFICRSGARSMMAARLVAEAAESQGRPIHCTNVAEGFEGDLDASRHRGRVNGWKVRGLPWLQH